MAKISENIKYLGIDWGEKRLGLAIADSETKMALPYKVAGNLKEILEVIKTEDIDFLVVGEPLKLLANKNDSRLNPRFLEFMELLEANVKLPIELIDERLSSRAADALFGDAKNKAPRDALAAMLILQHYLDKNA